MRNRTFHRDRRRLDSVAAAGRLRWPRRRAIAQQETDATIAALKPPKRQRPLIAIVGINDATETTDYLMPYGILKRADVADVVTLATAAGPMTLYPALKVEPQATVAEFDAQHPDGADYVIVPAMSRDDDPAALQWIRSQSARGAIVIGVCAGAKVVGDAGLLRRQAGDHALVFDQGAARRSIRRSATSKTGGWWSTTASRRRPESRASMPMSLTLIEAIAGRDKAEAVGRDIGLPNWDARHDSDAFQFTRPFALTAIGNTARVLEPRAARHRTQAPGRRSVAGAGRGRMVADLSLTRGDVCRHGRCAAEPQRHSHPARPGRHRLACGATVAAGDRGARPAEALDDTLRGIDSPRYAMTWTERGLHPSRRRGACHRVDTIATAPLAPAHHEGSAAPYTALTIITATARR